MWKNQHSDFSYHLSSAMKYITKTFRLIILDYVEHVHEMFEFVFSLSIPSNKFEDFESSDCTYHNKHFSEEVIF